MVLMEFIITDYVQRIYDKVCYTFAVLLVLTVKAITVTLHFQC